MSFLQTPKNTQSPSFLWKNKLIRYIYLAWQKLTQPPKSLQNITLQRKAHLLSSFLLVMVMTILFFLIGDIVKDFQIVDFSWKVEIGFVIFLFIYLLSRTRYYNLTAFLTTFIFPVFTLLVITQSDGLDPRNTLTVLFIGLLFGGMVLPIKGIIFIGFMNIGVIIFLQAQTLNRIFTQSELIVVIIIHTIGAIISVFAIYHRNLPELNRQRDLRRNEKRLRTMTEAVAAAILIYDEDKIYYANTPATHLTQYSYESLLNMSFRELVHSDFQKVIITKASELIDNRWYPAHYALKMVTKTNQVRWVNYSVSLFEFEGKQAILGTAFDITERKEAEDALRKNQQLLQNVIDNSTAVFYVKDITGRYMLINYQYEKLFNLDRNEVIGQTDADIFPVDIANNFQLNDQAVLQAGKALQSEEVVPQGGEFHTYLSIKFPLFDFNGEPYATAGISTDITERKEAEKLLADYNETLEQEVSIRTEELSETLKNLRATQDQLVESEKMAALGGLVAGVAHEINTPVGIGVSMSSLLAQETNKLLTIIRGGKIKLSELKAYLKMAEESSTLILNNLNRAANLVQSFKQVAIDQTSHQRRRFELKPYLEEIILSLKPELKRIEHTIEIEGDDTLVVDSYPGDFAQIVTNLVINSIIHGYQPNQILALGLHVKKINTQVKILYSDNGCGITPENLDRIFDPFFTTNRGHGGSGLGLYIIYNLVTQKLKGKIQCQSQTGEGTQFIIELPIQLDKTTNS